LACRTDADRDVLAALFARAALALAAVDLGVKAAFLTSSWDYRQRCTMVDPRRVPARRGVPACGTAIRLVAVSAGTSPAEYSNVVAYRHGGSVRTRSSSAIAESRGHLRHWRWSRLRAPRVSIRNRDRMTG
jgi:hypothetical protein